MRRTALVLTAVAVLLSFVTAGGVATLPTPATGKARLRVVGASPDTVGTYRMWLAESRLSPPNRTLVIEERTCDEFGGLACAKPRRHPAHIVFPWLVGSRSPTTWADWVSDRLEFLHEVGHVVDLRVGVNRPRRYRAVFKRIMGLRPAGPTWSFSPLTGKPGFWVDQSEQFAQAYAYCALNPAMIDPAVFDAWSGYSYAPSPAQHRRVCRLLLHTFGPGATTSPLLPQPVPENPPTPPVTVAPEPVPIRPTVGEPTD